MKTFEESTSLKEFIREPLRQELLFPEGSEWGERLKRVKTLKKDMEWLENLLSLGPMNVHLIYADGRKHGISRSRAQAAAKGLNTAVIKIASGRKDTYWAYRPGTEERRWIAVEFRPLEDVHHLWVAAVMSKLGYEFVGMDSTSCLQPMQWTHEESTGLYKWTEPGPFSRTANADAREDDEEDELWGEEQDLDESPEEGSGSDEQDGGGIL